MEQVTIYRLVERKPFTGFTSDDKYEGEIINDKRHGQGTMKYSNGDIYEGEWKEDHQNGKGTFKSHDGIFYTGEFKNNEYHGEGKFFLDLLFR